MKKTIFIILIWVVGFFGGAYICATCSANDKDANKNPAEQTANAATEQNTEQIQGRGQIVGDQAQVIHAQPHIPGPEEAAAAAQVLPEGLEEWKILMIVIRIQNRTVAEGLIAADEHDQEHAHTGNGKGQRQGAQFVFLGYAFHCCPPWVNNLSYSTTVFPRGKGTGSPFFPTKKHP